MFLTNDLLQFACVSCSPLLHFCRNIQFLIYSTTAIVFLLDQANHALRSVVGPNGFQARELCRRAVVFRRRDLTSDFFLDRGSRAVARGRIDLRGVFFFVSEGRITNPLILFEQLGVAQ